MKTKVIVLFFLALIRLAAFAQTDYTNDSAFIAKLFKICLSSNEISDNLYALCKQYPGRQAGSDNAEKAVLWSLEAMRKSGADSVYKQKTKVLNWKRKSPETCYFYDGKKKVALSVLSLGPSLGTGGKEITAKVIELKSLQELQSADSGLVCGKIVFLNGAMDSTLSSPFAAYGKAAGQRVYGAYEASRKGAVAVLVRSLNFKIDSFPRPGNMRYKNATIKIPALAISTHHAEILSQQLKANPELRVSLKSDIETGDDIDGHNAIGEINGSEFPKRVIVVGGHIDAWYNCEGAHDDGAGCVQSIEVLRILKEAGYKPRHTIRAVMFLDEEIDQRGSKTYAEEATKKGESHLIAIESDMGGFAPVGFSVDAKDEVFSKIKSYENLLQNFGPFKIRKGYGGVDVYPLKKYDTPLVGLEVVPYRYFDYQHSVKDSFETVSPRELKQGAAFMAALVYLIDKYGL